MANVRQTALLAASVAASLVSPRLAHAQASISAFDGHCHYSVPNWSTIDGATGEIYSHGVIVGNGKTECALLTDPSPGAGEGAGPDTCQGVGSSACSLDAGTNNGGCCTGSANLECQVVNGSNDCCHPNADAGCFDTSGNGQNSYCCSGECSWYFGECLNGFSYAIQNDNGPITETGVLPDFNEMIFTFPVPAEPDEPKNINTIVYWAGYQGTGPPGTPGSPGMIVQPELFWGTTPGTDTGSYFLQAQTAVGGVYYETAGYSGTPVSDIIEGTAAITSSNVETGYDGYEWTVTVQDTTTGDEALGIGLRTGLNSDGTIPQMKLANLGVMEIQGLRRCTGTSTDEAMSFTFSNVSQIGTAWNDYHSVLSSLSPTPSYSGLSPTCSWHAGWSAGSTTNMTWAD